MFARTAGPACPALWLATWAALALADAAAEAVPVAFDPARGLVRGGESYFVKGVGGGERDVARVAARGANSLRTWSSEGLAETLNAAVGHGLTVCAGVWLEPECGWFSYAKPEDCAKQTKRVLETVERHRGHRGLLCWGLGNEIEGDGGNIPLWQQLNRLAEAVKTADPAHPTFTAVAGLNEKKAAAMNEHAPALDFVGINTYGALAVLRRDLDRWGWKRPWLVTEYGPQGPWESPKAPWGAPLEKTSAEKALQVRANYEKALAPGGACLGGYAFVWGAKQEGSPTWFGLHTRAGDATATLDALQLAWTGRPPANTAPGIAGFGATRWLEVKAGTTTLPAALSTTALDADGDALAYAWQIVPEKAARDREGRELPVEPTWKSPAGGSSGTLSELPSLPPGEYRVLLEVTDGQGHAATANVPLRVTP